MPVTRCVVIGFAFMVLAAAPANASARRAPVRQPAAIASIGLRLVDVPVAARNDPRAQVYLVDHLAPGTVIHRRIEVSNTSTSPVHVVLYPAAANIAPGSFLGAAGHTRNELSTWTSVRPSASDVGADGRVTATVTVVVPRGAAPGERYGVVWAEARSTPAGGIGTTQVNRVGIRQYVSVGQGGAPASNFAIESLTAKRSPDGRPTILAAVHNTGGRALDLSGALQLSDGPGRLRAGPFPATLGVTLAIGATEPVTIPLDMRLPAGPWDAQITLHSGLVARTARATITFPNAGASAPVRTTSNGRTWSFLAIGGLATLLVGATAGLLAIPRPGRRRLAGIRALTPFGRK
jgi:hypothetical protein